MQGGSNLGLSIDLELL